uniref:Xylanolytic transcriptional activator regulatory domain-containing protein n=1 Tax=Bionectria ochroleuca TaxID=29856 RepID=A0A8H7K1Q5_BIOOC
MGMSHTGISESQISSDGSLNISPTVVNRPYSPGTSALTRAPSANSPPASNADPHTPAACSARSDTVVGSTGDMRYFGTLNPLHILRMATLRGFTCVHRHRSKASTMDFSPPKNPSPNESWSAWTHSSMQRLFAMRPEVPLPPWKEAFSLVSEFFDQEHQAIPCFHQPSFMTLLGQQYSGKSDRNPAWLACLNSVLAISQRRRVERGQDLSEKENLSWSYAANAMGNLLDILMRNTQLLSVQALLCMAWFFVGTPNPQPSFMLTGSAVRLAHSIGLHTSYEDRSWDSVEVEMRKRVFWIAVSLDSELCLRTGRPPAHNLHDFHVELPSDSLHNGDSDTIIISNGSSLNLFNAQCRLATIQGEIYRKLFSSHLPSTDRGWMVESVSRLTEKLETWASSTSPSFDMNEPLQRPEHQGLMRLFYVYHNCVIVANRGLGLQYWTSRSQVHFSALPSTAQVSIHRCLKASRAILGLNMVMSLGWRSYYWDVIGIISGAIIILCINALRQPEELTAAEDLRAISGTSKLLSLLDEENPNTYLRPLQSACEQLYRKARAAVNVHVREGSPSSQSGDFYTDGAREPSIDIHQGCDRLQNDNGRLQTPRDSHITEAGFGSRNDSNSQWGYTPEQPFIYPSLTPWSMDILMDDSFLNFY